MNILIIGGFLGSGKTSVVRKLLGELDGRGLRPIRQLPWSPCFVSFNSSNHTKKAVPQHRLFVFHFTDASAERSLRRP